MTGIRSERSVAEESAVGTATSPLPSQTGGVLLVHGAWHTGHGTWGEVAAGLEARGVRVGIAQLHRGSLAADTAAAAQVLEALAVDGPVVVCGHSFGGAVITGLPTAAVAHLVYLCAVMPDLGETALGLASSCAPTELMQAVRPLVPDGSTTYLEPSLAGSALYGHLPERERADHVGRLVPQVMAAGHQTPSSVGWREVSSTYVMTTDDRAVHPDLQRRLAARASASLQWDSDHAPFTGTWPPPWSTSSTAWQPLTRPGTADVSRRPRGRCSRFAGRYQRLPHTGPRAVQPGLHGSRADAQDARHLLTRKSLYVPQHEDATLVLRQGSDDLGDALDLQPAQHLILDVMAGEVDRQRCVVHQRPRPAQALVAHDPEQPRRQSTGCAQRPDALEQDDHRLLRGVLRILARRAQRVGEAAHVRVRRREQHGDRRGVPALRGNHGILGRPAHRSIVPAVPVPIPVPIPVPDGRPTATLADIHFRRPRRRPVPCGDDPLSGHGTRPPSAASRSGRGRPIHSSPPHDQATTSTVNNLSSHDS